MKKLPSISIPLLRAAPALTAACALFLGGVAHAQPYISSIYPDGTYQFQWTNKLSYTVESIPGVAPSGIVVTLYTTNLQWKQASAPQILTSTNGLTITGTATKRVVTTPLTSNLVYMAVIQATDVNGDLLQTNTFDTIQPSFTWEAEDYDYNGGQFIDNPQTNAYAALQATIGVDGYNPDNGGTAYRPVVGSGADGNCGNESNGDLPRVQYMDPNNPQTDYDIGWMSGGASVWANYTRHYPAGKWNIFLRAAGNPGGTEAADLYQKGTNGTFLGKFTVPNTGAWQIYGWAPLSDVAGNLIEWDTDGKTNTLTVLNNQGNWNGNYFMLIPVDPNYKPVPFVSSVSPNGSKVMFAQTNLFTFTVNSVPGMTKDNVVVTVNGITPYGLTIGGSAHVLTGSFPIATPNVAYTVVIKLTDANGSSTYTTSFSTYSTSNYTWECEDWDYNNGQYINNPQVDGYAGLTGVDGVDCHNSNGGGTNYRPADTGNLGNEINGDIPRSQFAGTNDYDIGWTTGGLWANYTRTYPKGVFNVLFRAAGNGGGNGVASLWTVSGGAATTKLGQFNVPNTGSWQTYTWTPMVDANGSVVTITNTGAVTTYRLNEDAGGWNGNFFMLVPPDTTKPVISHLYPNGSALFQQTNTLSFAVSAPVPLNTDLISVTLNGTAQPLSFSGPPTNLTVSCALQLNTAYTATIGVNTTNNNPASLTYSFDTFSSTNYTFEAEDFDYNGGQFFNNPQTNAYAGLGAISEVDAFNNNPGYGNSYRASDSGNLDIEVTGDLARAQYSAGVSDYDVGWTGGGQWANYTRTLPAGKYNVYVRAAAPSGSANAVSLSQVTSGLGTTNQTMTPLGVFNFPATGGWQTYAWAALVSTNGDLITVTTSGAVSTWRVSQVNANDNLNFFMLVPAAATAPKLTLVPNGTSGLTLSWVPAGGTLYSSPVLGSAANWQAVPNAANPMSIQPTNKAAYYRIK